MNACRSPSYEGLQDLVGSKYQRDIIVIATQEVSAGKGRIWETKLQDALGWNFVLADNRTHGSLQLVTFIRKELIWHTSAFQADAVTTRLISQVKTKGGLGVSWQFGGCLILFINSHLRAGREMLKQRVDEYYAN